MSPTTSFTGRRVLVTGHTGFKGAWLAEWLRALGAQVSGLALSAPTDPNLHGLLGGGGLVGGGDDGPADVRDAAAVRARFQATEPEIVFHLAAQSLVRSSYADPAGTFATNVLGTAHVLDAATAIPGVRAVVVVTSDKVYDPAASVPPFDEQSPLGGHDPYSGSKAACELLVASYRRSVLCDRGVAVATARAGNVIGGGDWAEDRIVPDLVRARAGGEELVVRYPDAVRPWQHVLDPLSGYLLLAERLLDEPAAAPEVCNFGPAPAAECSVAELVERFRVCFAGAPAWRVGLEPEPHETAVLQLSSQLATKTLGWHPRLTLDESVRWTADWHIAQERGDDVRALCAAQINEYEQRTT